MLFALEKKIPLVAVVGPTASGKTSLAVELAERLDGEVVSADSMQIYKGMDIATAKPTKEEMRQIPHHMISIIAPDVPFSVADYVKRASDIIRSISERGKLPILAGGTGLYINSLVDNVSFAEIKGNEQIRNELLERAEQEGTGVLLKELASFDPETAEKLHPNNKSRIIRAIEVYRVSGITMSEYVKCSKLIPSPYKAAMIGLSYRDRQVLYNRINRRVDAMIESGLIEETKRFFENDGHVTSAQAIGYKELYPYIIGESSLEESVEKLKRETRRYAKRQLTWFRRDERINWLYLDEMDSTDEALEKALDIIKDTFSN